MLYNKKMRKLIKKEERKNKKYQKYLIEKRFNLIGEDFYCLKKGFCISKKNVMETGCELSDYEWEGNEIYFTSSGSTLDLLKKALKIVRKLKRQMRKEYSDSSFDILLSLDLGNKEIEPSFTIRFNKVRDKYHIISPDELDKYDQPLILEQIFSK